MSPVRTARHGLALTWRNLLRLKHSPDQLLDVVVQPVTFVVLFVFVFGDAIAGNWHTYLQYVVPGITVQTLMFASMTTGLGLNTDVRTGIFDRFRSLPIARSAPLIGQVLGDMCRYVVSLLLVLVFGAVLGFRFHAGALAVLAACAVVMGFGFAMCWVGATVGMLAKRPSTVSVFSFVLVLPLMFSSNVLVPVGKLPGWLQAVARVNPVTQVSDAARALMLGTPGAHIVVDALLWSAAIVLVFAPLAVWAYLRPV